MQVPGGRHHAAGDQCGPGDRRTTSGPYERFVPPERRDLLRSALDAATLGTTVYELLNFWHLLEKLAAASAVIFGETPAPAVVAQWRMDLLNRNAAPDEIRTS
jgi:hypothetical protein